MTLDDAEAAYECCQNCDAAAKELFDVGAQRWCAVCAKKESDRQTKKTRKPKAEKIIRASTPSFSPMMEFTMSELLDEIERRSSACLVNCMMVNPVTNEVDYLSRAKGNPKTKTSLLDDLYDSHVAECADCEADDEEK